MFTVGREHDFVLEGAGDVDALRARLDAAAVADGETLFVAEFLLVAATRGGVEEVQVTVVVERRPGPLPGAEGAALLEDAAAAVPVLPVS